LADNAGKATATSTVHDVNLAGGAVKIGSVISTAQASSNGTKSTTSGSTVVTDKTVAGQRAHFRPTGLHSASASQPVNAAGGPAPAGSTGGETTGGTPSDLGGSSSIPGSSPQAGNSAATGTNQGHPGGTIGTSPAVFFGGTGSAWIVLTVVGAALAGFGAKRL